MGKKHGKNGKAKGRIKGWNGTSFFVPIWMQKKDKARSKKEERLKYGPDIPSV